MITTRTFTTLTRPQTPALASIRGWLAAATLLAANGLASAQPAQTYTISFFPELPVVGGQTSLSFDPRLARPVLAGATITETRLYVTFSTIGDFDAGELGIQLTAPIDNPSFGSLFVTGAGLGWSGQGNFEATLVSSALNGVIPEGGRAVWFFDLFRVDADPASFSGAFGLTSRIEFDYIPLPPPPPACRADFNADGEINADDLSDYINCYFSTDPCDGADFNADGDLNSDDLADFINEYFTGCS